VSSRLVRDGGPNLPDVDFAIPQLVEVFLLRCDLAGQKKLWFKLDQPVLHHRSQHVSSNTLL
jgi:hypothetical protein